MADRIVVFGATGYTGELIAARLVAAGVRPVLAGRSENRLSALAERLGGLEWTRADAMRQNTVFDLVGPPDVLVSTVGPFVKWGLPAARAAVAAGCTYIDTSGEPEFIRRLFDELDGPASRSGARLLPSLSYEFAAGTLAGALALDEAGDGAARVDVGYYALGAGPTSLSAGTRESLVGVTVGDHFAFRDGAVSTVRAAERVRSFEVDGKSREAVSIGGAEHYALPATYQGLREVNVYLGGLGPLSRALQAGSLVGTAVQKLPLARPTMRFWGERAVSLVGGPDAGTTGDVRSDIVAEALDAGGEVLARVELVGPDPYDFTASLIAWAAQREVSGAAGVLGPISAFGLSDFEAGARSAGLARTP
ncbi:saccharopine dehydrogenase NADP-binding domain-containing protein [Solirubrobacter sp. CPCC 204708]|uniref:Saccharopine dehydrogenase NADP-binding domain-containing protein n=1 Tax=Solirubrobacter deserti TaxID=2282478 RepID=A0ABT4RHL1_9ACTN|nr:saccharopine dehydrogenase NADP-binding domain-containing protein [Solirubrobacter deserti]MBE2315355.1 saccharopine dehydrogenase NADP-binding domain-containing protein [Solirubrobacter deserti]MDA0137800.1 saccharopine dehydrogenase NADP-binding domain-containing protein [Solirubrobacter deserti]